MIKIPQATAPYTKSDLQRHFAFYGNKCLVCGSEEITVDHVVPVTAGGRDVLENIQPLCKPCNSRKGARTLDYRPALSPYVSKNAGCSVVIRVREIAVSRGLNLSQVARQTGLDIGMVRRYWNNESSVMSLPALEALCWLFECQPGDLLEFVPTDRLT